MTQIDIRVIRNFASLALLFLCGFLLNIFVLPIYKLIFGSWADGVDWEEFAYPIYISLDYLPFGLVFGLMLFILLDSDKPWRWISGFYIVTLFSLEWWLIRKWEYIIFIGTYVSLNKSGEIVSSVKYISWLNVFSTIADPLAIFSSMTLGYHLPRIAISLHRKYIS